MYNILSLPTKGYESNSYALISSGECLIIDPSVELCVAYEFIEKYAPSVNIKAVLLTHCHYDHIIGISSYHDRGIPIYVSREDGALLSDPVGCAAVLFGRSDGVYCGEYSVTDENAQLTAGDQTLRVIRTPGHTAGSVCYLGDGYIFTGDTIFCRGSYGRYDLPTGDGDELFCSIKSLLQLPADTVIYPGHMGCSTIGEERKYYRF